MFNGNIRNTVVNVNYVQSEHYREITREQTSKTLSEDFRILIISKFPSPLQPKLLTTFLNPFMKVNCLLFNH